MRICLLTIFYYEDKMLLMFATLNIKHGYFNQQIILFNNR